MMTTKTQKAGAVIILFYLEVLPGKKREKKKRYV